VGTGRSAHGWTLQRSVMGSGSGGDSSSSSSSSDNGSIEGDVDGYSGLTSILLGAVVVRGVLCSQRARAGDLIFTCPHTCAPKDPCKNIDRHH